MTKVLNPIDSLDSPSPTVPADAVCWLLRERYGFNGGLTPLASDRDQIFRLTTSDECHYIVRISNAAEEGVNIDFQAQAFQHIARQKCVVAVPRIIPTQDGSLATTISNGDETHVVRLVSYVEGRVLGDAVIDAALARRLGRSLAQLGIALRGFEHPGENQVFLWDMQRASGLRPLLPQVLDDGLRDIVSHCLDEFEQNALPIFDSLRHQVIHGDLNPGNVLVAENGDDAIVGIIDFGDMVRAPLIVDVAIAASYLRSGDKNPLQLIAPFVAGYNEVTTLDNIEVELLYDLVRTRICTTVTMMYWRCAERSQDDVYTQKNLQSESGAERYLMLINSMTRKNFIGPIRQACSR